MIITYTEREREREAVILSGHCNCSRSGGTLAAAPDPGQNETINTNKATDNGLCYQFHDLLQIMPVNQRFIFFYYPHSSEIIR